MIEELLCTIMYIGSLMGKEFISVNNSKFLVDGAKLITRRIVNDYLSTHEWKLYLPTPTNFIMPDDLCVDRIYTSITKSQ